jgi:predicted ester cyclase
MNKKIIIDYMNEVWNKKNLSVIDKVFSGSAIIHSPLGEFSNPLEMQTIVEKWTKAIPDMRVTLLNIVEENGLVIAHWMSKGTHQKELNGIPPKGNPLEYQGISMYRMDKGKVIEYWAFIDSWAIIKQMSGM